MSMSNRTIGVLSGLGALLVVGVVVAGALGREGDALPELPPVRPGEEPPPLVIPSACGRADPDKPPEVAFVLENGELDFGSVRQGEVLERKVRFQSVGRGTLCALRVTTTCGCVRVSLGDRGRIEYEPGAEGVIDVRLDTTGRDADVDKTITLETNDARGGRQSFRVKAQIERGLLVSPGFIGFGRVALGSQGEARLFFRAPKDRAPLEIKRIIGTREWLPGVTLDYEYTVEHVEDPNVQRSVVVITQPPLDRLGPFGDRLVIETNDEERPRIVLESSTQVVPKLIPTPPRFVLGTVTAGAPSRTQRVKLRNMTRDEEIRVTGVRIEAREGERTPADGFGFVVTHGRSGQVEWVEVGYDGKRRAAGMREAVCVIETDDPGSEPLRLEVRATVR